MTTSTFSVKRTAVKTWLLATVLSGFALAAFFPQAQAYQVKRVLNGSYSIGTGTEVGTIDLGISSDPLDLAKTMVLFSYVSNSSDNARNYTDVMTLLDDPQTVQFSRRATSSNTISVDYSVVEFVSGVEVTTGMTTVAESGSSSLVKTITLPVSVDLSKAFPLISWKPYTGDRGQDERNIFRAEITDINKLTLTRGEASYNSDVFYQVVAFDPDDDDVNVQHGTVDIDNSGTGDAGESSDNGTVVTVPVSSVDMNKAFLVFSSNPDSGVGGYECRYAVDGRLTNSTTLTFTRYQNSSRVTISWYLVELKNMFTNSVQRDRLSGISTTPQTDTLGTALYDTLTMPMISISGPNNTGSTSYLYDILWRGQFAAAGGTPPTLSTLNFNRYTGATNQTWVAWQAVELPMLHIKNPDTAQILHIGDNINIQWEHAKCLESGGGFGDGSVRVKLLLSMDGGTSYPLLIAENLSAKADSYSWTIPERLEVDAARGTYQNIIDNDLRVRVVCTEVYTARNYDSSNYNFEVKGSLAIDAPTSAMQQESSWIAGNPTAYGVKWTPKGNLSDYPTTGNGDVNIEYSPDNGSHWYSLSGGYTVDAGLHNIQQTYNWNIPAEYTISLVDYPTIGKDNLIRISFDGDATVTDTSDAFWIKGSLTLTDPTGGEIWLTEQPTGNNITWDQTGFDSEATISIYYSKNSGVDYTLIPGAGGVSADDGTYHWDIDGSVVGAATRIKIVSNHADADLRVESASAADFTVAASIDLLSPASSAVWYATDPATITWEINGSMDFVHLWWSNDSGSTWNRITGDAGLAASGGSYVDWPVPEAMCGTQCQICVSQRVADGETEPGPVNDVVRDGSGAVTPFTVKGKLVLGSAFDGGAMYEAGSSQNIVWNAYGSNLGNITILYAADGVTFSETVTSTTPASNQTFSWTLPATPTDKAKIKIQLSDTTINDVSADYFIIGSLNITRPDGGESLLVMSSDTVTWINNKFTGTANITYSDDNGADGYPHPIASGVAIADGAKSFTVPDAIGDQLRVMIASVDSPSVSDVSAGTFTIYGDIIFDGGAGDSPVSGTRWLVGSNPEIRWTTIGTIPNVKLSLSTNGGTTFDVPIHAKLSNLDVCDTSEIGWSVPDQMGINQALVKVCTPDDYTETYAEAISAPFTIHGAVSGVSVDTAVWLKGDTTHSVSWVATGNIDNVKVEYSTISNTPPWTTIVADQGGFGPGSRTYSVWSAGVPDLKSDTCYIRVSDVNDYTNVYGISGQFAIRPKITVSEPGTAIGVGSSPLRVESIVANAVQWSLNGSSLVSNVNLLYSTTGSGGTYTTVEGGANVPAGDGQFTWTVPNVAASNACYVKVVDAANPNVYGTSAAFKIMADLILSQPVGSEDWFVGDTNRQIVWDKNGTINTINIYADYGAGYNPVPIASVAGTLSSWDWTPIPDQVGNNVRIKITDADFESDTIDESAVFHIVRKFVVNKPESVVYSSDPYTVTWTGTASGTCLVDVDFYNGTGWTAVAADVSSNGLAGGSAAYTFPANTDSTGCKFRVTANDQPASVSESAVFTVRVGKFTVDAPATTLYCTDTYNVHWTSQSSGVTKVKIEFYNGTAWSDIATGVDNDGTNGGNRSITVPANTDSMSCKFRVTATTPDQPASASESSAFTVKVGKFTVSQPNTLLSGDPYSITWTSESAGVTKVKLDFYDGSSWANFATNVDNSGVSGGSYPWTVPGTTNSAACKLRVTATAPEEQALSASETNAFWVHGKIEFTGVTTPSPTAGVMWTVGESRNINFKTTGKIDTVDILYSKTGTVPYTYTVVAGLDVSSGGAGEKTRSWTIPSDQDILSKTQARIRIQDSVQTTVYGESPLFMIRGTISVTAPVGTDVFTYGGVPTNITWTYTGLISNVKLSYSTNDGVTYDFPINSGNAVAVTPSTFAWAIPDKILGDIIHVKVEDADNDLCFGTSDAFAIIGQVQLNAPVGGEKWPVSSTQNVLWVPTGTFQTNVRIEASVDDFSTHLLDITRPAGASGVQQSYPWVIPTTASNTVKVRVSDVNNQGAVKDVSDSTFKILGSVDVRVPESGEVWYKGETNKKIEWDAAGSVTNVKIEYKTSSGGAYTTIAADDSGHSDGPNSYTWSAGVADENSESCYVRVSDATNYDDCFSVSASTFSIRPVITVTEPGTTLTSVVAGSNGTPIRWTINGSKVTLVNVEYSIDGGAWTAVQGGTGISASLGDSFTWSGVPATKSSNVMIRVVDAANSNVKDESNVFGIIGSITMNILQSTPLSWEVGTSHNISWSQALAISTVEAYYSLNGGTNWTLIGEAPAATGYVTWSIPVGQAVNHNVKLKIIDKDDTTNLVKSESVQPLDVRATFVLNAPLNGASWVAETLNQIQWTASGSGLTAVVIQYSTDNGSSWNYVNPVDPYTVTNTVGANQHNWTIPAAALSNQCKIRIYDPANTSYAYGHSELDNFWIKGQITVTEPNGGESFSVGSSDNPIQWTKKGSIDEVTIYYSADDGSNYTLVAANVDATLATYPWTIDPAASLTTIGKIKVCDEDFESFVFGVSSNSFTVKGNIFNVTPSGGTLTYDGVSTTNISWEKYGAITTVQLYYSTNGGNAGGGNYPPGNFIVERAADATPYPWTIPNAIGSNLRVLVQDKNNTSVSGESANTFSIKGSVHLDAPNGAESWVAGTTQQVKWTPTGTYASNVKLEYSQDGGSTWVGTPIATPAAGASGVQQSQNWQIPDDIRINAKVKVSTQTGTPAIEVEDASDAVFNIVGAIVLDYPNGGQVLNVGATNESIQWTSTGTVTPVKLEYSVNNGSSWATVAGGESVAAAAGPNSFAWNPVPNEKSEECLVRVSDARAGLSSITTDTSATVFSIRPVITVTEPGTTVTSVVAGSNGTPIRWTITGSKVTTVNVEYSIDGGAWTAVQGGTGIAASLGATFTWSGVPATKSSNVRIRVVDTANSNVIDESNTFSIIGSLVMDILQSTPLSWEVGTSHNISWSQALAISTVEAYYSLNGGTNWTLIGEAPAAQGYVAWNIPVDQPVNHNVKIKVQDKTDSNVKSESLQPLDVRATFVLNAPLNGASWVAETLNQIQWTASGAGLSAVVIQYSTDNGSSWNYVNPVDPYTVTNTVGANQHNWTIPAAALSNQCKIRIYDPANTSYTYGHGILENFWIKGQITVTEPNGGESFSVGSSGNPIQWTRKGTIDEVTLYYSADNGSNYTLIAANVDASLATYPWTIDPASALTTTGKIKVCDEDFESFVFGVSSNSFTVKGNIFNVTPSGGTLTYDGVSTTNISWEKYGAITTVQLYYSTNGGNAGGGNYPPGNFIVERAAGATPYPWTIPNAVGSNLRVMVMDKDNNSVWGESASVFSIKGSVHLDAPNGTEAWVKGTTQQVKWTPTGTYSGNVKLEYSTDAGSTWVGTPIATPAAGASGVQQSQNWQIPDAIDTDIMVRVSTQTGVPAIEAVDVSDAVFNIIGAVNLDAPNGGNAWYVGETTRTIDWSSTGTVTPVKLEYSVNNGTAWFTINDNVIGVEGANSYAWNPVPNEKSEQCLVRVSDARIGLSALTTDTSAAIFAIRPQITVDNMGPLVSAGATGVPVRWTITGTKVNFVNVEYSVDGGAWTAVPGGTNIQASLGTTFTWDGVPGVRSSNVRVRVVDVDNSSIVGLSNTFSIIGSLTLLAPNGTPTREQWKVGEDHVISWSSSAVNTVNVYYSLNGGTDWILLGEKAAATGNYTWTMTEDQLVSNNVKVKITDKENESQVSDISEQPFDIIAVFDITAPESGATVIAEDPYLVTWTKKGTGVNDVILEYSTDGGSSWNYVNGTSPYTVSNSGNYPWPAVPGTTLSTNCKVRVRDPNNSAAVDTGAGSFWLRGQITITRPTVGNESWGAGTAELIKWTKKGNIGNVTIYYSPANGADGTWEQIGTGISGDIGSTGWSWSIPAEVSLTTTGRVKICQGAFPDNVYSTSAQPFEIKGSVQLVTPSAGGISVDVGNSYSVTFNVFGAISSVDFYLSTNGGEGGGGSYPMTPFASKTSLVGGLNTYSWTVPDSIGGSCRLKVVDTNNSTVWDESDSNFEIKGKVTVDLPNGGETWYVGDTGVIKWTPLGTYSQVKIEYSTNGFSDELETHAITQTSAGSSGVQQTYNWNPVENFISEAVKVRVSDADRPVVQDVSNSAFRIRGRLLVNVPNGDEKWYVGTKHWIEWTTTGTIPNVKLEYSTNNGSTYTPIVESVANTNSYEWTIPDAIGNSLKTRVSDTRYASEINDATDGVFKVRGQLALTAPVGSLPEAWIVGSTQAVTWTKQGSIPTVNIYYSTDGGTTWPGVISEGADGNSGTATWAPIPDSPSTTVKVKIYDTRYENDTVSISPANFKIIGSLTMTKPDVGAEWEVGSSSKIEWSKTGNIARVKLELSTDGGANYTYQITDNAAGGGLQHYWDIPSNVPGIISPTCKIKISDYNDSSVFDVMDGNFAVQPVFTFTSQLGGEVYTVGDSTSITWTTLGSCPNVKIEYTPDGLTWKSIKETWSNSGSCPWTIPDDMSDTVKIRISDTRDATASRESGNFVIRGAITLTQPETNDIWIVNASLPVQWALTGSIEEVKLEFSENGGSSWTTFANPVDADQGAAGYPWTCPDAIGSDNKVRISDANRISTLPYTSGNFIIRGALTVVKPNGPADQWTAGQTKNIEWTRTGSIANVQISLSTNGGSTYSVIKDSTAAEPLFWAWTIPSDFALSTNLKIKVADASDADNVKDESDANFAVIGSLELTYPNAGGTLYVGESKDITWVRNGLIQNISIEISTNGFADESQTHFIAATTDATGTPAGSYKYSATVGNYIGSNTKIRIKDTSNPNVYDVSDAPFIIKGVLTMDYPNGSETLIVDDSLTVRWTPRGTIELVRIDYSTDSGSSYPFVLVASTSGTAGQVITTVPDAIGTGVKFRVSDLSDMSQPDDSDSSFTVKGRAVLTAPVTAVSWAVGTKHNITWERHGSFANVKIDYTNDNWGTTKPVIASTDASLGYYEWTVPDDISSSVKVRVANAIDPSVSDVSPVNFKIVGIVTVTSPIASTRWEVGVPQTITWTKTGAGLVDVRIDFSKNGGSSWTNIVPQVAAGSLSYGYTPLAENVSTSAMVRISDYSDSTVTDDSEVFHVRARFTVTAPTNGNVLAVQSSKDIVWTTAGDVSTVKIDYSVDSGATWDPISPSTSNTGLFPWTVPDDISATCKVRVSDFNNSEAFGESTGLFKIRGDITVTQPSDAGISWTVGTQQNITWSLVGSVSKVNIYYATDGSTFTNPVTTGLNATPSTFLWTVPDALSKTCKVRVMDNGDATVYGTSSNNFTIRGALAVDAPVGTDEWEVNSFQTVRWHRAAGSIQYIKIDYSTDNGNTYPYTIIDSIEANLNEYLWQVANTISNTVVVRVTDTSNDQVKAMSPAFRIKGKLTLTRPNGDEVFVYNTKENVTWDLAGNIVAVKLEYSPDLGTTWKSIVPSISAALKTYEWTIPDDISKNCLVKVTNLAAPDVYDVSDVKFKIIGTLTLIYPTGGQVWPVGSTQDVSWQRGGSIANVKVEYSINGGSSWPYVLSASIPAVNGSLGGFVVADTISPNVLVRVTDLDEPTLVTVQNATPLKIRGDLVLTRPDGAEVFLINSSEAVTWQRFGSIANAKLEYSINGGSTYPYTIIASISAALGTHPWTVPDNPATACRVRISDASDPTVSDYSANNFTIRGGFVITSPNGGEALAVNSQHSITWTTFGSYANVKLWYSKNNGSTWDLISASSPNSGAFLWTVPDAISSQCLVKIGDITDVEAVDVSNAVFAIRGSVTLTAPNGGEAWGVGTSQTITWTKVGAILSYRLEYSTNGFADEDHNVLINDSVPGASLSYAWTVPDAIGTTLKVRVADANDAVNVQDVSDATFRIRGAVTVVSPNGGEAWVVNSPQTITWTSQGSVANVKLEYSIDGGSSWTIIVSSTGNTGSRPWTVPDTISSQCRIRISDATDSDANDVSNNNFKIHGQLTITSPNGAEKWAVGASKVITWARVGSIANVRLEYSDNGGTTYVPIIASTANAGSYGWTVPDAITIQALVRIYDVTDLTVTDVSDAVFKIQGSFTVTTPNGGDAWQAASENTINWTSNGSVNFVRISYSKDSGTTWTEIVASTANDGEYTWFVPVEAVSTTERIKVADAGDDEAFDISNSDFRVRCTLVVTSPNNGTEQWRVGQTRNITWNKVGNPAAVKIEFSRDSFITDFNTIVASTSPNSPYAWTIADNVVNPVSNTVKIRVSDAADYGARDDSDANFRITGNVTVTAPNGAQQWEVNSLQTITWTTAGSNPSLNMPNVKIEYSTDGGASYDIIEAVPNSGSYLWTVPDDISAACRVRVSDLADATANDISDANFKIKSKFTVTSPNDGTEVWTVGEKHNITWTNVGTVNNVKLDYSTNGGSSFVAIVASTPNTGTYEWTIPDAISTQCRVRVGSATDADAYDVSDANFRIKGKFILSSPNGGELWRIALDYPVNWTTIGTISTVRLLYSTDDGASYPLTIVNSVGNSNSYTWHVPDTRTPTARVKIVSVADADVFDESDASFRIQGSFSLTAPNGGEIWVAESSHNIAWNWGGTLPFVKLSYSIDGGSSYPYVINAAAPNGAGGEGSQTYAWTIPGTLSGTCRVRIEDPDDDTVNDVSNANFKIAGEITVTTPAGGERWVTNEKHNIVWTQKGTIPTVKIQYSKDSFVSNVITVTASVENTSSYEWTIPDDRAAAVKVRVLDTRDETIYGTSSGTFRIDYYTVTWVLRDLLTNVGLTNLGVIEKATGTENIRWSQTGLTSPVTVQVPYGFWTTTWSATGYGDKGQNYTADSDQSFELFMETTAVHIWRAEARFSWDADERELNATAWLERDGSIVTGVKSVAINIYDGDGTLITTMNAPSTSAEGYFTMVYDDSANKLKAGVVYAALVDLTNLSDAHFKTPTSFSITETERLKNTEEAVGNLVTNTLPTFQATVQATINTGIAEQKQMITEKMDEQTDLIEDNMAEQTHLLVGDKSKEDILNAGGMVGMVQNALTSFETSASTAITKLQEGAETAATAGQELEATAKKYSWGVTVAPSPVMSGDAVTLSIQGQPKKQPSVTVYSWDSLVLIPPSIAAPDPATDGLYRFSFNADSRFSAGKAFTYLVTEFSTGGFVTGSAMVESMGISTVAGLAAAAPEAERAAKKALDAIKAVEAVLVSKDNVNIAVTLQNLKESIDTLPEQINKEGGKEQMMGAINEVSEKLNKILGDEGLDLGGLLDEKLGSDSTMKEMRNKTDSIQAVVDLLLQIIEGRLGGVDEPIVSTSLQSGSVKFRIVVVNPSRTKTQKVKIKKFLPEEVQLKDIMDAGGLDLEFDADKSIYYAYKNDVELQPGESRVYEVEVEDVWLIPQTRIEDLKRQVANAPSRFKNTEFAGRVEELAKTAPAVLDEMLKTQTDETISREQHIGVYRQNTQTIRRIEEELAKLEQMISPKVGTQVPEVFEKSRLKVNLPGKTTTWLIILIIIVFLGLLAGVFFFVWQFQMKAGQDAQKQAARDAFTDKKPEAKK